MRAGLRVAPEDFGDALALGALAGGQPRAQIKYLGQHGCPLPCRGVRMLHLVRDPAAEHDVKYTILGQVLKSIHKRVMLGPVTVKRVRIECDVASARIDRAAVGEGNTGLHEDMDWMLCQTCNDGVGGRQAAERALGSGAAPCCSQLVWSLLQRLGTIENEERSENIKDRSMSQSCRMENFAKNGSH